MLFELCIVFMFLFVGMAFVFAALFLGSIARPRRLRRERAATYECGETPVGKAWYNFNPRFYMLALVFLVFDVEIVATYPVVAVFRSWVERGDGWLAFAEIFLFVSILAVGFCFLWLRGDLEWIKQIDMYQSDKEIS